MSRAPRWGCSVTAHSRLGWCGCCPGVDLLAEVLAWRLYASGVLGCDYAWALQQIAEREPVAKSVRHAS